MILWRKKLWYYGQNYGTILITCLLYTSDAADDMQCVDLGGRRIIKKQRLVFRVCGRDIVA